MEKIINSRKKINHDNLILGILEAKDLKTLKDLVWDAYKFGYLDRVEDGGEIIVDDINYSVNKENENNKFLFRYYSGPEVITGLLNSKLEELKINNLIYSKNTNNDAGNLIKSNFMISVQDDKSGLERKISKSKPKGRTDNKKIEALTLVAKKAHETRRLDRIIDDLVHIATAYGYISISENGFVLENGAAKDFFETLKEYEEYKKEPEDEPIKIEKKKKEPDFEISPNILDLRAR